MKKQLLLACSLLLAIPFYIDAWIVNAQNNTDAPIILEASGACGPQEITVAPTETRELDFGGCCPWGASIRDAGTLSVPPARVQLDYSAGNHCSNKHLRVSRHDNFASNASTQITVTTGGTSNSAPRYVDSRYFIVTTDTPSNEGNTVKGNIN